MAHSSSFIHWLTWHKLQEIEYIMWFFRHISYSLAEGRTSINLIIHTRALLSRWQFLRLRRLLIHDIPLIPYPGSLLVTICAVKQLIIFHLHGAALFPPLTGAPWNTSYSRAYAPSTPSQHHHHHYTPPHTTTPHYTPPHTTTHHYTPPHTSLSLSLSLAGWALVIPLSALFKWLLIVLINCCWAADW